MFKRSMVSVLVGLLGLSILVGGCGSNSAGETNKIRIGILQQVEHPALDASTEGFKAGLAERGYKDGENVELDFQNAQGEHSNMESITNRFVSDKDTLIYVVGTAASQIVANATKDIPIVGAAIYDYKGTGLVQSVEKPGTNVTGTTNFNPVPKQLDLILKVLPNTKEVGVIYSSSEVNAQIQVAAFKEYAASKGIQVVEETITSVNDIPQVTTNLINKGVKVIYTPTDNLIASAMPNLVAVAEAAKVPVFVSDGMLIEKGGFMGYTVDFYQLGLQAGHMAADILDGKSKPEDMPVQMQATMKLATNPDMAKKLGITIPDDLPQEAK